MTITIGWAVFDAAHPPVDVRVGFAEFDAGAVVEPSAPIYGGGGALSRYHSAHDEDAPKQFSIRVHAENDEEEQIILNLIMEFARHVL